MAMIRARPRPNRDGVERSNDFNCRIANTFRARDANIPAKSGATRKMGRLRVRVEGAAKIAMPPSSGRGFAVDFLP
jgi:hypothetical protein